MKTSLLYVNMEKTVFLNAGYPKLIIENWMLKGDTKTSLELNTLSDFDSVIACKEFAFLTERVFNNIAKNITKQ